MLFITVRSASPADVPRVLQVVEQVKRLQHKRGTWPFILPPPKPLTRTSEVNAGALREELHQYVVYDAQPRAPRRIKLDDPPAKEYTPPSSLTVHLSKISMPELRPQAVAPKTQQQRPAAFPMPRTGPAPPPLPLREASPPRRGLLKSSSSSAPKNQRGHSMIFTSAMTPPPPQSTRQEAAWRGSLWGRSRK